MTCKECSLILGNKVNGFRFGNSKSKLIIIRPYPTRQECSNNTGDTRQNKWLLQRLTDVGFTEDMYHIVNLINCYPIKNITYDELQHCSSKLKNIINGKPKLIMTLGTEPYNYMTGLNIKSINQVINSRPDIYKPPIVANYTVGQAMNKDDIKSLFIGKLYILKKLYRLLIDINI